MHIMIDIETLGINPTAPILSIGALAFNPHADSENFVRTGKEFYLNLNWKDQVWKGAVVEPDTAAWWEKQKPEVKEEAFKGSTDSLSDQVGLITYFLGSQGMEYIWANSPSFDLILLKTLYARADAPYPVRYSKELDVRSIKASWRMLWPSAPLPEFQGDAHHPLTDCWNQARLIREFYEKVRNGTTA